MFAEALAHGHVSALQSELAALGHGIVGSSDLVHDDLLELSGVGAGVSGLGGEAGHQFNVLADQGAQEPFHVADDGVNVYDFEFEEPLAAERPAPPAPRGGG